MSNDVSDTLSKLFIALVEAVSNCSLLVDCTITDKVAHKEPEVGGVLIAERRLDLYGRVAYVLWMAEQRHRERIAHLKFLSKDPTARCPNRMVGG